MLRQFNITRRTRKEGISSEKKNRKIRSIFRKKSKKSKSIKSNTVQETPPLAPALTLTLSQESQFENDLGVSTSTYETTQTTSSGASKEIAVLDADPLLDEEFVQEDAIPTCSPKAEKISKFIFTEQELMINELNHMRELAEKQQEIDKMQNVLDELQQTLVEKEKELVNTKAELFTAEEELAEVYLECSDLDNELCETKAEVMTKVEELQIVSSTLMQCQADLHEVSAAQGGGIASITNVFWSMLN